LLQRFFNSGSPHLGTMGEATPVCGKGGGGIQFRRLDRHSGTLDSNPIRTRVFKLQQNSSSRSVFKSMNLTYSFPSIFQMLWHSINPCFDIKSWTSGITDIGHLLRRKLLKIFNDDVFKVKFLSISIINTTLIFWFYYSLDTVDSA
jgi:hypothetical protein